MSPQTEIGVDTERTFGSSIKISIALFIQYQKTMKLLNTFLQRVLICDSVKISHFLMDSMHAFKSIIMERPGHGLIGHKLAI